MVPEPFAVRRAGAGCGDRQHALGEPAAVGTVGHGLRRFTQTTLQPLVQLDPNVVLDTLEWLAVSRVTLDVDGTIVRNGPTVGWAFRGFNPHHRKARSYDPLLAHVAQTGHILRLENRPGNVHDSKQASAFLRGVIAAVRERFRRRLLLQFRMDAAFFQRDVVRLLAGRAQPRGTPAGGAPDDATYRPPGLGVVNP